MECEICGREAQKLKLCVVEGNELWLCKKCEKFGIEKKESKKTPIPKRIVHFPKSKIEDEISVLKRGYGDIIRKARQRRNLTIEELAKKIYEKESYLRRIENEQTQPEERVIKKLEKFLGIELREQME